MQIKRAPISCSATDWEGQQAVLFYSASCHAPHSKLYSLSPASPPPSPTSPCVSDVILLEYTQLAMRHMSNPSCSALIPCSAPLAVLCCHLTIAIITHLTTFLTSPPLQVPYQLGPLQGDDGERWMGHSTLHYLKLRFVFNNDISDLLRAVSIGSRVVVTVQPVPSLTTYH